jgi:hypothetical protein
MSARQQYEELLKALSRGQTAEEALRELQIKRHKKLITKKTWLLVLVSTITQFWWAQLVVWGLSMLSVSTGIWPIWLIMEGVSSMLVATVTLGMMYAVRDTRG